MLRLVSHRYPPDNVPAAHRPYQVARQLEHAGVKFRLHTRFGVSDVAESVGVDLPLKAVQTTGRRRNVFTLLSILLYPVFQVEKSLPWALLSFPRVWLGLLNDWVRVGKRPDVWATAPGVTNLYVAGVSAMLSGSRLHVDLRDAIPGINSRRAPFLTWCVLRYATTCTVVTESLALMVDKKFPHLNSKVAYNGISEEASNHSDAHVARKDGWIKLSYAGAVYGGERPYDSLFIALQKAVINLSSDWYGIEITFVGREDVSELVTKYQSDRLRIISYGEIPKDAALQLASKSDVNIVLVGAILEHRCAIPLKVFDLLGIGRPILYYGPLDGDGCKLLTAIAPKHIFLIDSEEHADLNVKDLALWLADQTVSPTEVIYEPNAASECQKIIGAIYKGFS